MSILEERFLSEKGKTLVKTSDPEAVNLCLVLKKCLVKGDFVLRGGLSSNHKFIFDNIY